MKSLKLGLAFEVRGDTFASRRFFYEALRCTSRAALDSVRYYRPMENMTHRKVLSNVLSLLEPLDAESRRRVMDTVLTFFGEDRRGESTSGTWDAVDVSKIPRATQSVPFSQKLDITPKDFLLQKQPRTDVERVACLGYYLSHFRAVPHFKTQEITSLNTEAAQPKFSNAAKAVSNASQYGYLAPATKGSKQMSAQGEQFVIALPDRDSAHAAMTLRPRRGRNKVRLKHPNAKQPKIVDDMQTAKRKNPLKKV